MSYADRTDRKELVLNLLLKGTNTFFLTKCLNYNFTIPTEYPERKKFIEDDILRYNKKIDRFFKCKKKTISSLEPFQNDYSQRAEQASLYFQQALELYRTSISMPPNTKPLVEYYSLLQAVKGTIRLELDFEKGYYFDHHGLSEVDDNDVYIRAKIKDVGVFPAFLIRFSSIYDYGKEEGNNRFEFTMDKYINKKYRPSLEELFKELLRNPNPQPPETFITSWMLSMLVRYKPALWQKLLSGKCDEMSIDLQTFHDLKVPQTFNSLFQKNYGAEEFSPYW